MSSADYEKLGVFYLGRDEQNAPYLYESKHLMTHGVVIGMTGSGKTGLAVGLLEEAAIDALPAIVIDPKGDLTNLLLTFPELSESAFAPWAPEGKSAKDEAALWSKGLADWGQDGARIQRLRDAAEFTVYTPGSTAGRPVSILASLEAPEGGLEGEALRDRVGNVTGSLLGLLGIEADPVKSREYILLSTILASHWSKGKSLDLAGLILRIQDPKISKIGVLDLDSFYPQKERFELAIQFNNLLASPGFETWLQGDALDIGAMLRSPAGKPRVSIFSIAHLGDQERMFFVTLLLGQVLTWMRSQSGTTSLRALLYMDEIFGYFPPVANPPSKAPLLTLLKQARAFGLGVVLASQNPVDLDYKGLSNAGSWFIGRLQTERDKARVIEGLEGAAGGRQVDKDALGRLISGLKSRQFLVHNVHSVDGPVLIQSRWTLSYLRGPLTREHLRMLKGKEHSASADSNAAATAVSAAASADDGSDLPVLPQGITQLFAQAPSAVLTPYALGAAIVRINDAKLKVEVERRVVFAAPLQEGPVALRWDDAKWVGQDVTELATEAPEDAKGLPVPSLALKPKSYAAWQKDFVTWLAQNQGTSLYRATALGLTSLPGESENDFRSRIAHGAREERDGIVEKLRAKYTPKFEKLREQIRVGEAKALDAQVSARNDTLAQGIGVGASVLGAIFGRSSAAGLARGAASAVRGASRAKAKSQSAERLGDTVEVLQQKWRDLEAEFQATVAQATANLNEAAAELETLTLKPKKTGIQVELMALYWA
jgi:hypothetical protein